MDGLFMVHVRPSASLRLFNRAVSFIRSPRMMHMFARLPLRAHLFLCILFPTPYEDVNDSSEHSITLFRLDLAIICPYMVECMTYLLSGF